MRLYSLLFSFYFIFPSFKRKWLLYDFFCGLVLSCLVIAQVPITAETSFVGEMTFRSQDSKLLDEAAKAIRELKKVSQDRELKRKEQEDIVEQPKLIEGKGAV